MLLLVPLAAAAPPPLGSPNPVVEWLPLVLAAALGAVLARLAVRWERRKPVALVRLGSGTGFRPYPGLPGVGDGNAVWFVPAAERATFLLDLSERLATRGPVLLLAHPDRRAELWATIGPTTRPIWTAQTLRPTVRDVLQAGAALATDGQVPVIVVDGPGALEPAPADRPDAAAREVLDASSFPVFLVLAEGEAAPGGRRRTITRVHRSGDGFVQGGPS